MMISDKKITKKDLKKIFFRSFTLEASWNFERQQNMGFEFAMADLIEKLYGDDKEARAQAGARHLEFFNTSAPLSTFIMGIVASMEERNANDPRNFDPGSITNIKTALMGPLAGIGDSFFWGTLRVIATGVGTSLALNGSILGPLLFLLIYNVPTYTIRYFGTMKGYEFGTTILENVESSGLMKSLMYGASILGLMVIGGMTGNMVTVKVAGSIGQGDDLQKFQDILDGILPNLLSVVAVMLIYYLLKKGVKTTYLLFGIFAFGIIAAYFGFLTV
ncbi:PTS system mannose/fructose/sorbose family transporter subunit IID [Enterococcus mundtii]|uniref:PTS mannose transporter subunit IID n=1 Tax=Enterococcus mundtii TaxID=53346 RepID=A0A2S7RX99_ENTMU|nr:PTS system mannose/fructose/sorbose family transporter subunit IID [Enterococcus mundtii]PQF24650.1 PTS mannose transporter subunit IID [Enterococcus mundtii]